MKVPFGFRALDLSLLCKKKIIGSVTTDTDLAKAIVTDPDNPVEDVAYRFALKLYGYACTSFDAKMRNVFGIAAEFIDKEVIGLFRTEDGVYP